MQKLSSIAAVLAIGVCSVPALVQAAPACPPSFVLDTNPRIGLDELGKLDESEFFQPDASHGYGWEVMAFNYEDHPHERGLTGIAIVRATAGDLGERGVGGLLWSREPAELETDQSHAFDSRDGGVTLVFITKPEDGCPSERFVFHLNLDGVGSANGHRIGSLSENQ